MIAHRTRGALAGLAAGIVLLASGARDASGAGSVGGPGLPDAGDALVFPGPPQPARVRFLRSIADIDAYAGSPSRSWWARIVEKVIGPEERPRLVKPWGIEAAGEDLFICDPGADIVHGFLGPECRYVRIPRKGRLRSPIDAAVDREGNLYVSDSELAVVNCYDRNGELRFALEGPFSRPTGVAYQETRNRLLVVDTAAHRVYLHTLDGTRIGEFGTRGIGDGEFNFPTGIFVGRDGRIYVTDSLNFRVQIFGPDGAFLREFGHLGDGVGDFSKPKGVAADSDGNVYVVDSIFDAFRIFDDDGNLLLSIGEAGRDPGEFWLPTGITIDGDDRIYVADSYNGRVQVFQYLGN